MKNKFTNRLRNKKAFTLAELLIVVAIIGVLVAIAIPVFNNQLEKSRESTDAANIRAAVAEITSAYLLSDDGTIEDISEYDVSLKQTVSGWATTPDIGGCTLAGSPTSGGTCTFTIDANGNITATCD